MVCHMRRFPRASVAWDQSPRARPSAAKKIRLRNAPRCCPAGSKGPGDKSAGGRSAGETGCRLHRRRAAKAERSPAGRGQPQAATISAANPAVSRLTPIPMLIAASIAFLRSPSCEIHSSWGAAKAAIEADREEVRRSRASTERLNKAGYGLMFHWSPWSIGSDETDVSQRTRKFNRQRSDSCLFGPKCHGQVSREVMRLTRSRIDCRCRSEMPGASCTFRNALARASGPSPLRRSKSQANSSARDSSSRCCALPSKADASPGRGRSQRWPNSWAITAAISLGSSMSRRAEVRKIEPSGHAYAAAIGDSRT
jgi:hypothetical protein